MINKIIPGIWRICPLYLPSVSAFARGLRPWANPDTSGRYAEFQVLLNVYKRSFDHLGAMHFLGNQTIFSPQTQKQIVFPTRQETNKQFPVYLITNNLYYLEHLSFKSEVPKESFFPQQSEKQTFILSAIANRTFLSPRPFQVE